MPDASVSRHHCELRTDARGLELRDLGSTNGTFGAQGGGSVARGGSKRIADVSGWCAPSDAVASSSARSRRIWLRLS